MKNDSAKIDLWFREVAPSSQLRKWFKHDPKKWREFQERYNKVLDAKSQLLDELRRPGRKYRTVTLLFAAKDETFNQAVALKQMLS